MEIESKKKLLENPMKMRQLKELVRFKKIKIKITFVYFRYHKDLMRIARKEVISIEEEEEEDQILIVVVMMKD